MRKKVTIQEIADLVGVSKFAVSRALSAKSGVSPQTRETILKAAGQLGYFRQPEQNQQMPIRQSAPRPDSNWRPNGTESGTIVVLFPNVRYQNRDSIYWGPIFEGITNRLEQRGLDFLTVTEPSGDNLFSLLNPGAIRGIITIGAVSTHILLDIAKTKIPTVMVDHDDPAFPCDTVFVDNFHAMKQLMVRLISKGYRSYQFVGPIQDALSFELRWLAFKSALEEHEIPLQQDPLLISAQAYDIYLMMQQYPLDNLPEVFVCAHDVNASYLIEELAKRGLNVPADCVVTGFDNTMEEAPILATIDVNKGWLGTRAVDQLLWRLDCPDSSPERKLIAGELVVREQHGRKTVSSV
ncbi:LacI family DNA-binding transcriptional regulator [Paenibacillus daejeonensis]|uniref:LacI family DNA-binding transcriptional regulator n=1 Tax=Paenibacillus daejeonensis TaxID=135193 RepID=UPI00037DD805|nr:LacI family DNA-binding transcriptional regulator [Paenibacillus daejeonensis]